MPKKISFTCFSMWSWNNFLIILTLKKGEKSLHYKKTCWPSWDCEIICLELTYLKEKKLQPWLLSAVVFFNALFYLEFLWHEHLPRRQSEVSWALIPPKILECHTKSTLNKSTLGPQCKPSTVSKFLFPQFTMGNISVQTSWPRQ